MNPTAEAESKQARNRVLNLGAHSCLSQHQIVSAFFIVVMGFPTQIEDTNSLEENPNLENVLACVLHKMILGHLGNSMG